VAAFPAAPAELSVDALPATGLDAHALVTQHFEYVWRLLRRLGLSEADADDAAQRVFVIVARKLGTVHQGGERAFLYGVAVRVASRAHRSTARRRDVEALDGHEHSDDGPRPDELVDRKHAREILDRILLSMKFELRAVFVMYEIEGMTAPQIADALAIPAGTVASRLRRAREDFEAHAQRIRARESFRVRLG
jgi:RNA polymerase sigma-70 factor (ECF subfamily)